MIGSKEVFSYNTSTGEQLIPPTAYATSNAQVNQQTKGFVDAEGKFMLTLGGGGQELLVWDMSDRLAPRVRADLTSANVYYDADMSPDGRRVVTAGSGKQSNTAILWNAKTQNPIGDPMEHEKRIDRVRFAPDARRILTLGTTEGVVRVWSGRHAKPISPPLKIWGVRDAVFDPTGKKLAIVSADGGVMICHADSGREIWRTSVYPLDGGSVTYSPDGKFLAVTGTSDVSEGLMRWSASVVLKTDTGQKATGILRHDAGLGSLGRSGAVFSPDNQLLLTNSSMGKTVRVWDLTRNGVPLVEPLVHPRMIGSVQFDLTSTRVITGCTDGKIRQWNLPRTVAAP